MCSVAEFETLSTAESMWFPGVSLSDVSVSLRCFDWMAILSGCSGYILSSARGTENFIIISHRCGNRRKFTSMFNLPRWHVLCQRCRLLMKFQVPLTDYGNCIRNQPNEVAILSNIGKTYFYTKRDTCREKHRILQLRLQLL